MLNISLVRDTNTCTTGSLSGVVRDAASGAAKVGASVQVVGGSLTTSGAGGAYSLGSVAAGQVTIRVSLAGYAEYSRRINAC